MSTKRTYGIIIIGCLVSGTICSANSGERKPQAQKGEQAVGKDLSSGTLTVDVRYLLANQLMKVAREVIVDSLKPGSKGITITRAKDALQSSRALFTCWLLIERETTIMMSVTSKKNILNEWKIVGVRESTLSSGKSTVRLHDKLSGADYILSFRTIAGRTDNASPEATSELRMNISITTLHSDLTSTEYYVVDTIFVVPARGDKRIPLREK